MPTNFLPKKHFAGPRNPVSQLSGWQLLRLTVTQFLALCGSQVLRLPSNSQRFYLLERSVWRRPCKCMPPFGNSTWRLALPPLSETNKRSQSSRLGWEDDSRWKFWKILAHSWKRAEWWVLNFPCFQEPARRKSYAEILNGDDEEDEKVEEMTKERLICENVSR